MCGIAGIVSLNERPVSLEDLQRMCGAMAHRGPDDEGFYLKGGVGLGMRRLSIIDVAGGHQPMSNEACAERSCFDLAQHRRSNGSIWVVFNGEIYNFKELRVELERRGHSFCSATDTETIVHLYEEYGPRCVEKMRGMFAFALWDERQRELLLARDRLGIKPLYYAEVGGRLVFASELKVILQLPEVERKLNWEAVSHLFTFLSTPHSESIIEGIHKLEPGHILIASPGRGLRVERYWDVRFEPDYSHKEDYFVERLRELLEESVRLHMESDVPLGAFLSGGIDSSSVVATMARLSSTPVRTFSIGFTEGDYNELSYARLVAEKFGTEHYELVLKPDVLEIIDDLSWYLDEPFGDPSAIPTYMVSKLASECVTVVLSGDGGDELFGGYDKYVVEKKERRYGLLASPVRGLLGKIGNLIPEGMRGRNFLRHFALAGADRYMDAFGLFAPDDRNRLFTPEVFELLAHHDPWRAEIETLAKVKTNWLSALQYLDLKSYLPLDILTKVDRMSMAHSIEARVPLLDHKLVEFAATIPPEMLLRKDTTKYVFKRAMRGILPDATLNRRKQGFAIPLGTWFKGQLEGFVRELLLSDRSKQRGIFNGGYIEKVLEMHRKRGNRDLELWTLISFELWCRTFLDQQPRASSPKVIGPYLIQDRPHCGSSLI